MEMLRAVARILLIQQNVVSDELHTELIVSISIRDCCINKMRESACKLKKHLSNVA